MNYKTDNLLVLLNDLSKISNIIDRMSSFYRPEALKDYFKDENLKFGMSPIDKCAEGSKGVNEFFNYYDNLLEQFSSNL
jgi:hypothetical protein